jgi:hypothetical protein
MSTPLANTAQTAAAITNRTVAHLPWRRTRSAEPADDVRVVALDVIEILAARLALLVVLTLRVLTSHPFVVHVEPAKKALALAGCGDRHDDLPRSKLAPNVTLMAGVAGSCHRS